jgi:hypothetical protein
MLMKLLSSSHQSLLIDLSELLALSDNQLLWDGKTADEITSDTDLDELSIQQNDLEREFIDEMKRSSDNDYHLSARIGYFSDRSIAKSKLIKTLKTYPITKSELPDTRIESAITVFKELIEGESFEEISVPKIMLYELFLVALQDGHISEVEMAFLKAFQDHFEIEDFMFDDILERAEALTQEMSTTISLVLE